MGTASASAGTFGAKLRLELNRQDIGVRTLARKIANGHDARSVETVRRRLNKYLAGVTPTDASRREVEEALGLDRDALRDDDDAEADQRMHALHLLFGDLVDRLVEAKLAAREGASA